MKKLLWLSLLFLAASASAQFVPHAPAHGAYCLNPSGVWIPVATSQTASSLPNGAPATDLYAINGSTWFGLACDSSGHIDGSGAPGGSNGQVQWNQNGDFGGATGGLTNGTHWAWGTGATVDGGPTSIAGEGSSPRFVISNIQETSTSTASEGGQALVLTLNPSGALADPFQYGSVTRVIAEGANWTGVALTGNWNYAQYTGATSIGTLIGNSTESDNESSGEVNAAYGGLFINVNVAGGTEDLAYGGGFDVDNVGSGTIGNANILDVKYNGGGNGSTGAAIAGVDIEPPNLGAGDTIGENWGMYVDEQCGAGITTCHEMQLVGTGPSQIAGLVDFGDLVAPGILTLASGTTKIAAATGEGWQFNCSDCDTPLTEGSTCTSAGDHAGALAIALRGAIKCF